MIIPDEGGGRSLPSDETNLLKSLSVWAVSVENTPGERFLNYGILAFFFGGLTALVLADVIKKSWYPFFHRKTQETLHKLDKTMQKKLPEERFKKYCKLRGIRIKSQSEEEERTNDENKPADTSRPDPPPNPTEDLSRGLGSTDIEKAKDATTTVNPIPSSDSTSVVPSTASRATEEPPKIEDTYKSHGANTDLAKLFAKDEYYRRRSSESARSAKAGQAGGEKVYEQRDEKLEKSVENDAAGSRQDTHDESKDSGLKPS